VDGDSLAKKRYPQPFPLDTSVTNGKIGSDSEQKLQTSNTTSRPEQVLQIVGYSAEVQPSISYVGI